MEIIYKMKFLKILLVLSRSNLVFSYSLPPQNTISNTKITNFTTKNTNVNLINKVDSSNKYEKTEQDSNSGINERIYFPPYKFPFWGLPYGIISKGGFFNPGLFPFVPGGVGFPPYDGIFGGPTKINNRSRSKKKKAYKKKNKKNCNNSKNIAPPPLNTTQIETYPNYNKSYNFIPQNNGKYYSKIPNENLTLHRPSLTYPPYLSYNYAQPYPRLQPYYFVRTQQPLFLSTHILQPKIITQELLPSNLLSNMFVLPQIQQQHPTSYNNYQISKQ